MKKILILLTFPLLFLACQSAEDYFAGSSYTASIGGCTGKLYFQVDKTLFSTTTCNPGVVTPGSWSIANTLVTITLSGFGTENCPFDMGMGTISCTGINYTRD